MNVFGSAEYPALKIVQYEQERYSKPPLLTSDTDVSINYKFVYEVKESRIKVAYRLLYCFSSEIVASIKILLRYSAIYHSLTFIFCYVFFSYQGW